MTTPVLELRRMDADDEGQVLDLLTTTMAGGPTGARTADFFRWKHRDNPFGRSPGLVAVHDGRIVGLRLFLRWCLVAGDRQLRAVRPVDTATHPEYQRQGIFSRLTTALLEELDAAGDVDLVFNTPNAESRPGYLRLGWREVGTLPVHVSPVHLLAFARGMRAAGRANSSGPSTAVRPTAGPPPASPLPPASAAFADESALAELLPQVAPSRLLRTPRSVPYLRWRYVDVPGLDYRAVMVHRGGEPAGVGFGRLRRRAGLVELTLGEVLVRRGDAKAAAAVLRAARDSGADHVAVHATPGSEVADRLASSGYLRVRGRGVTLFANPRRPVSPDPLRQSSWGLSLGDLEVF